MERSRANGSSSKPSPRAPRVAASYVGLRPASERASATARATSRKRDTRCELVLRKALWSRGLRYRVAPGNLPGRPDLVFPGVRVAVFCDGDFWHGRSLAQRLARLQSGHNAPYWVAKISGNVARDARVNAALRALGWTVVRVWEGDVKAQLTNVLAQISAVVRTKSSLSGDRVSSR